MIVSTEMRRKVAGAVLAAAAFFVPASAWAQEEEVTIEPPTGDVFLMKDEQVFLSVSSEPDPGEAPEDMTCCAAEGENPEEPLEPVPVVTREWSGDVITEESEGEETYRLDTDSEGDKSVTVKFFVKWLCPNPDSPDTPPEDTNPEDPGEEFASATADYTVVKPEVVKVGFNDSHALKKWSDKSDIQNPVWEKTLGGAVTKNEAAAYTKEGAAKAELFIEADTALTNAVSVDVQGVKVANDDENFFPTGATFHNWTWQSGELVLDSSPLYASVNFYDTLGIKWQYRLTNGDEPGEWVDMNESTHKLYTTKATPTASPLYDFGVDKACRYAANETADGNIADKCSTGIDNDIVYEPGTGLKAHPLDEYGGAGAVCQANALLLKYLCNAVGVAASVEFMWGGSNATTACYYRDGTWWGPTFQITRAAHDNCGADPAFTYHAQTVVGSTNYDPSFGTTGRPTFTKTAPAGVSYYTAATVTSTRIGTASPGTARQTGAAYPPATKHYYDGTP